MLKLIIKKLDIINQAIDMYPATTLGIFSFFPQTSQNTHAYFPHSILLFDRGRQLKLCDFGTAKKLEHTLTNAVGTIRYMAPEVIRGCYE